MKVKGKRLNQTKVKGGSAYTKYINQVKVGFTFTMYVQ